METGSKKSKHPCGVCARRKVKCDRLIPCTNCIKRGQENECIDASQRDAKKKDYNLELFKFWHKYEFYVVNVGLFKLKYADYNTKLGEPSLRWFNNVQSIMNIINLDQSFRLLEYSVEKLGPLFFGCLSDIREIYVKLDDYWERKDENIIPNIDECYWDALLWALFTLAVYYISSEELVAIFPRGHPKKFSADQESDGLQQSLLNAFTECTIGHLYSANFMANPDVKLIQVYVILCNMNFCWRYTHLSDALLIQCLHVAKMFHVDDFRPLINESTAVYLNKSTCEKLWYRLCTCDYLQSTPQRAISCHQEISSLLQHAAYLEDLPNIDVNQSEENFEVLYWKLISLDRDLDQYLISSTKAPLRTLDAIQRQTDIFHNKISTLMGEESFGLKFEKFLAIFLLRTVCWKLSKMYFIFYNIPSSLDTSVHHAKSLIALLVNNVNIKRTLFNKHPFILISLSRVISFYTFANIFMKNRMIEEMAADLKELLTSLSPVFGDKLKNLENIVDRMDRLKSLWDKVLLIDKDRNPFQHPVILILRNDVERINEVLQIRPPLIKDTGFQKSKRSFQDDSDGNNREVDLVVTNFEGNFNIDDIFM